MEEERRTTTSHNGKSEICSPSCKSFLTPTLCHHFHTGCCFVVVVNIIIIVIIITVITIAIVVSAVVVIVVVINM